MKRRLLFPLLALLSGPGCGDSTENVHILTSAEWKDHPGSVAELGFWISVDVGWPDKRTSCAPFPDKLHVTVNGREGERVDFYTGDCVWDVVYKAGPFTADMGSAITVRVLDGDHLIGEAFHDALFPTCAIPLASPTENKARVGESLAFTLPTDWPDMGSYRYIPRFYWLDPAPGVPPFYSYGRSELRDDGRTLLVKAPSIVGRAALVFDLCSSNYSPAKSCQGFSSCMGWTARSTAPIEVEVLP